MRYYIERLGCPKNDVDADYLTGRLARDGHVVVNSAEDADAVIVNTCAFILPAKQESVGELLRHGARKRGGGIQTLIATGCMAQRHGEELLAEIPELDAVCGLGSFEEIAQVMNGSAKGRLSQKVETRNLSYIVGTDRAITDSLPYAYLKISEGCDRKCSYCVIPQMRGSYRSRSIEEIVREAEFLASAGKRELILVSQEATVYGGDRSDGANIISLLTALENIDGIAWIRLVYLHPHALKSELLEYISTSKKVVRYYDLPLQHIADGMLKRMRRQVRREGIERLLDSIRSSQPDAIIRTTFIVGFPGESDAHFAELYEFAQNFGFDRMGSFAYSQEDGSPAALMPDQIEETVMAERVAALSELQDGIIESRHRKISGREMIALLDTKEEDGRFVGRTYADCPDIDPVVKLTIPVVVGAEQSAFAQNKAKPDYRNSNAVFAPGQMVRFRVSGDEGMDLRGEIIGAWN